MHKSRHGAPSEYLRSVVASPPDECALWPFAVSNGYGTLQWPGRTGLMVGAHVMSLEMSGRPKPPGDLVARHLCNTKLCVNPNHLAWGTRSENHRDRWGGPTDQRGAGSPRAKLTPEQVLGIREQHAQGASARGIAKRMGLNPETVRAIVLRKSWTTI